jgi:hypothetical protein
MIEIFQQSSTGDEFGINCLPLIIEFSTSVEACQHLEKLETSSFNFQDCFVIATNLQSIIGVKNGILNNENNSIITVVLCSKSCTNKTELLAASLLHKPCKGMNKLSKTAPNAFFFCADVAKAKPRLVQFLLLYKTNCTCRCLAVSYSLQN